MTDTYFLMKHDKAEIYIKRDDLIPFSFGGNKARIAAEAFSDMERGGFDAVISYGSGSSNLNRVVAQLAASKGVSCTVILKDEGLREAKGRSADISGRSSYNEILVRASGARVVRCLPDNVKETVEAEFLRLKELNYKPYYIYGDSGGRGHETILMEAYVKAYEEIRSFEAAIGSSFSTIFHASGTGITQSGLIAGKLLRKGDEAIIGISIARDKERQKKIVASNLRTYLRTFGRKDSGSAKSETFVRGLSKDESRFIALSDKIDESVDVSDSYVGEGYGAKDEAISLLCRRMMNDCGLPLDTTYTGKAFFGMLEEIEKRGIEGPVLFIHTGGLPLLFDALYSSVVG